MDKLSPMNSLSQVFNSDSIKTTMHGLILSPKLASGISWLIILSILYMLANVSWGLWEYLQPRETIRVTQPVTPTSSKPASGTDIQQLVSYNLFGSVKTTTTKDANAPIDAPVTRLKLKLRGVYAASDEQMAGAMIEAQNKQEVYRIGSKLPGAAGLKLHKIMSDRVIMSRNGKFETLLIEDFGQGGSIGTSIRNRNLNSSIPDRSTDDINSSEDSNTIDKRNDAALASEINKLRGKLTDPQSLSELVAVSPAMEGDEFQGFRLTPGKNRALFGRLGLRRNDVVTQVNGISLDDPTSAFSLMEQIRTADDITLTVKRGDREMNIMFSAQSQ